MSPKIPVITAKELIRALKRAGFSKDHQRGSHLTLINVTTFAYPIGTGCIFGVYSGACQNTPRPVPIG